jgi:hypothetical protein
MARDWPTTGLSAIVPAFDGDQANGRDAPADRWLSPPLIPPAIGGSKDL